MAAACNYHPANRATHNCERCIRGFCMACFPAAAADPHQWRQRSLRCPLCRKPLTPRAPVGLHRWLSVLAPLRHPLPLALLALAAAASFFLPSGPRWQVPAVWGVTVTLIVLFILARRRRPAASVTAVTPRTERRRSPATPEDTDRDSALARARILTVEGDYNGARRVLMDALRRYTGDPELNERYYRLLLVSKDTRSLRELAPHLLEKLVRLNRTHKAARFYLATTPRPIIDKSHLRHALAEALFRQRKFVEAAHLLRNLHREDSHYRQLEAAYLLLARIYLEGLKRPDDAARLLLYLRREFPRGRLARQVQALQQRVANTRQPA